MSWNYPYGTPVPMFLHVRDIHSDMPRGRSTIKAVGARLRARLSAAAGKRRAVSRKTALSVVRSANRTPKFELGSMRGPVHNTVSYRNQTSISTGALNATPGIWSFNANSTYSPEYSGGGHQPLYRDQIAALFTDYKVMYATVTMRGTLNPTYNTSTGPCYVAMVGTTEVAVATNVIFNNMMEDRAMMKVGPKTLSVGGNSTFYMKKRFKIAQLLGFTDLEYAAGNFNTMTIGGNPPTLCYITFYISGADTSGVSSAAVDVVVDYEVVWSNPIRPAQS